MREILENSFNIEYSNGKINLFYEEDSSFPISIEEGNYLKISYENDEYYFNKDWKVKYFKYSWSNSLSEWKYKEKNIFSLNAGFSRLLKTYLQENIVEWKLTENKWIIEGFFPKDEFEVLYINYLSDERMKQMQEYKEFIWINSYWVSSVKRILSHNPLVSDNIKDEYEKYFNEVLHNLEKDTLTKDFVEVIIKNLSKIDHYDDFKTNINKYKESLIKYFDLFTEYQKWVLEF